jgi:hypothetical protein
MVYAPPLRGFRTFVIMWLTQSLSVIGSGMTGFALNVYLAQTLYPAPEQKAELALAFTILNLASGFPTFLAAPSRAPGSTVTIANKFSSQQTSPKA